MFQIGALTRLFLLVKKKEVIFINKEDLVKEIIEMCKFFEIRGIEDNAFFRKRFKANLKVIAFIETLLDIFDRQAKIKNIKVSANQIKLKELVEKLEIIRANLEFKDF